MLEKYTCFTVLQTSVYMVYVKNLISDISDRNLHVNYMAPENHV